MKKYKLFIRDSLNKWIMKNHKKYNYKVAGFTCTNQFSATLLAYWNKGDRSDEKR